MKKILGLLLALVLGASRLEAQALQKTFTLTSSVSTGDPIKLVDTGVNLHKITVYLVSGTVSAGACGLYGSTDGGQTFASTIISDQVVAATPVNVALTSGVFNYVEVKCGTPIVGTGVVHVTWQGYVDRAGGAAGSSAQVAYFNSSLAVVGSSGLTYDGAGGLTVAQGTLSGASTPFLTETGTWSNVATTFVNETVNITDTNSATASAFLRYQVGGTTAFRVRKDGSVSDTDTFAQAGINLTQGRYVTTGTAGGNIRFLSQNNAGGVLIFGNGGSSSAQSATNAIHVFTAGTIGPNTGSGNFNIHDITYTINATGAQSGTVDGIRVVATETNLNSFIHNLLDLQAGSSPATVFKVANSGIATAQSYNTLTNCQDSAGAAACGSAAAGHFVIDAAATSTVVSTTAVTASSEIVVTEDASLGSLLGITCNTQSQLIVGPPKVTARSAGVSFTVSIEVGPTTNPGCYGFTIRN